MTLQLNIVMSFMPMSLVFQPNVMPSEPENGPVGQKGQECQSRFRNIFDSALKCGSITLTIVPQLC